MNMVVADADGQDRSVGTGRDATTAHVPAPMLQRKPSLKSMESRGSFISARDASFWVAVSAASSFSAASSSSRGSSAADLRALDLHTTHHHEHAADDLDLSPIAINVDDDGDEDTNGATASNAARAEEEPPMTSPPPPLEGLRRPTILHNRRHRERLNSDWRSSTSSSSSASEPKPSPPLDPPLPIAQHPPIARGTPVAPFEMAVEEVYEHQRYQMVLGWGSKGHLLPLDPGKYVRIVRASLAEGRGETSSGRRRSSLVALAIGGDGLVQATSSSTFPDVALPDTAGDGRKWEWISPWHLELPKSDDGDVDPDGWRYASSFNQFPSWREDLADALGGSEPNDATSSSAQISSRGRPKLYVRRRKWVRFRRLRHEGDHQIRVHHTAAASPFDDSFLDSMCGWLRKLGHVRKNWKMRYFVLEKSVLRYYADEAMTRLKGEVLLFHPATRVHYVDIHLSSGRDNTFEIQVGPEYSLLLQAERLSDRENWMYCIEDALLCRDSYLQDPTRTQDVRDSVARRRKFSSESLLFSLAKDAPHGTPMSQLSFHSNAVVQATRRNPLMMRLVVECDAYLEGKEVKQQIATFLDKFKQKYGAGTSPTSTGNPVSPASPARSNGDERNSLSRAERRRGSDVSILQDPRCQLALKNYRFFLERSMEEIMEHLQQLAFVNASVEVTSPRSNDARPSSLPEDSCCAMSDAPPTSGDIDWELAKKAALYKLERLTFIPLQEIVYGLLESTINYEDVLHFEDNRQYLARKSQAFFEIRPSHLSPTNWKSASLLLDTMDDYSLPTEKASILLEVAKCIYDTYAEEHAVSEIHSMAADDFLPIFIFILSRSKLRNVVIARHLISETMISCVMIGETGYYATMFEAAMSYIAAFHGAAKEAEPSPPRG